MKHLLVLLSLAAALSAQDLQALSSQCADLLRSGKDREAEKVASQLIRADKKHWSGYFFRAEARTGLGRFKNALVDYNRAVSLSRKEEDSDRAVILLGSGRCRFVLSK